MCMCNDLVLAGNAEVAKVGPQGSCSGWLPTISGFCHRWLAARLCSGAAAHLAARCGLRLKAVSSRQVIRPFPDMCWRHGHGAQGMSSRAVTLHISQLRGDTHLRPPVCICLWCLKRT